MDGSINHWTLSAGHPLLQSSSGSDAVTTADGAVTPQVERVVVSSLDECGKYRMFEQNVDRTRAAELLDVNT